MSYKTLEMRNITKEFPGVRALKDVSIHLNKGEILALVGENGAGKSTLMKIMSGLYPYGSYSGSIILNGKEQRFHTPWDSAHNGLAMIYQDINVELDLSVAENICIGSLPKNKFGLINWKRVNKLAIEQLNKLQLEIDVTLPIRNFSTSTQQLICIARALKHNPSILILDEPTSSLTESEAEHLSSILKSLKEIDISSIYISHKMEEVFRICDRLYVLRDGELISEHKKQSFNVSTIIQEIIGRNIENMYPEKTNKEANEISLKVSNLTVQHPYSPSKYSVENISFDLKKGEILGMAGLIGSGRSEIMEAIFGLRKIVNGSISISSQQVTINNPEDAIKNGIGFLTEERNENGLVSSLDVKQNMTLSILNRLSAYSFINKKKEETTSMEYVDLLSIKTPSLKKNIMDLSGGNQQKVILAKWILTKPQILFLDEPTKGIDIGAKAEIYTILNQLSSQGISILFVSSELPELLAVCDRILVLREGKIIDEYKYGQATENTIMHAISFG